MQGHRSQTAHFRACLIPCMIQRDLEHGMELAGGLSELTRGKHLQK